MAKSADVTVAELVGRRPVQIQVTSQNRIVVLCDDHSIWQRILDPQNFTGGEKFVWARVEGPPAE
jgi:hypothetical protein